jgi:hypothetical protein
MTWLGSDGTDRRPAHGADSLRSSLNAVSLGRIRSPLMEDPSQAQQIALTALQSSGYPFQTAIAALISTIPGWTLSEQEIPWCDPSGSDRFLDLTARSENIRLCMECKKTNKETFTFLLPEGFSATESERISCLNAYNVDDSTRRIIIEGRDWLVAPSSPESAFCVVSTSATGRDRRLLEPDAQDLTRATDAVASGLIASGQPSWQVPTPLLYISVLVTNAPLFLAAYDPSQVPLDTGVLSPSSRALDAAPFVRFRKAFTSHEGLGERTVFVVNALQLAGFLGALEPKGATLDGPRGRLDKLARRPRS